MKRKRGRPRQLALSEAAKNSLSIRLTAWYIRQGGKYLALPAVRSSLKQLKLNLYPNERG